MVSDHELPPGATLAYSGVLFQVWQWQERLFDGTIATFEAVRRPDTVYVIPVLDTLARMTWRRQPGRTTTRGFFGGRVEVGESAPVAARRELIEEAGFVADTLYPWFSTQLSPKVIWISHVFLASGCTEAASAYRDRGEDFSPIDCTLDELLAAAARDDFAHTDLAAPLLRIAHDPALKVQAQRLFTSRA